MPRKVPYFLTHLIALVWLAVLSGHGVAAAPKITLYTYKLESIDLIALRNEVYDYFSSKYAGSFEIKDAPIKRVVEVMNHRPGVCVIASEVDDENFVLVRPVFDIRYAVYSYSLLPPDPDRDPLKDYNRPVITLAGGASTTVAKALGLRVFEVSDRQQMLRMLASGRSQFIIAQSNIIEPLALDMGIANLVKVKDFYRSYAELICSKKTDPSVIAQLSELWDEGRRTGLIDGIFKKYEFEDSLPALGVALRD
ncbi:hypothetical protein JM93_01773 [Roseibium hamelinense]|uniref:Solute-binding protein family 3/N-terminal domain-containing protein n=1 Tax=Roseibium hamelinense TaxID=150831 RepID=A0A562T7G7_9HYPH|nr:amino acid ABC transporter substrate-binding protein [Roseibium hamelinense]MTI42343.1 hypothetical protein [Roseibium hamelinense]TWI89569.1 hypothetical protein JM93_01773 [Roseibium hamelinense]